MIPRPDLLTAASPPGLEVFQLTDEPDLPSCHIYMEAQIFTPDSRHFVLHRSAHPHDSDLHDPRHVYQLCDVQTGELTSLTTETGVTAPAVSPDGRTLYYFVNETRVGGGRLSLKRVQLDGTSRETIVVVDKALPETTYRPSIIYPLSSIASDGRRIALSAFLGSGARDGEPWGMMVFDLDQATLQLVLHGESWCNVHPQYSRSLNANACRDILVQENHGWLTDAAGNVTYPGEGAGADIHVIRDDGSDFRNMPWGRDGHEFCQGHQCWRGRSEVAITSAGLPGRPLEYGHAEILCEGTAAPSSGHVGRLTPGGRRNELSREITSPRFFHFATDIAGERFIVDANPQPERGCELYTARLGEPLADPLQQLTYLLNTRSDFYGGAHPHPFLSPDGRTGFFNSDESGCLQAYMLRNIDVV